MPRAQFAWPEGRSPNSPARKAQPGVRVFGATRMSDTALGVRRRRWPLFVPFAVVVVLAIVWSAVWYYAAQIVERNIAAWMDQEARNGRVYTCASRSVGGYPFRIEVRCSDPSAEIKAAPLALKAKEFVAVAQVYQPNLIIGEIVGPLSIGAPGQPITLVSDWTLAQASVRLNPMPERISIVIDSAKFEQTNAGTTQPIASAGHIELHVRLTPASEQDKQALEFAATLTGATVPSAGPLATQPFDAQFAAVLRGVGDFRPKSLPARLKEWQAAGGRLEITNARIKQGDAVAVATGDLGLSPSGRVDGTVGVTLAGFEQFVQMLLAGKGKNTGLLAVAGLSFLGKPADLDGKRAILVPLRFADGAIYFGPILLAKTAPLY